MSVEFSKDPADFKTGRMESCRLCRRVSFDSVEITKLAAELTGICATGSANLVDLRAIHNTLPKIEERITEIRADIAAYHAAKKVAEENSND